MLGPFYADTFEAAEELLQGFYSKAKGRKVVAHVPELSKNGMKLAEKYKMRLFLETVKLYTEGAYPVDYNAVYINSSLTYD